MEIADVWQELRDRCMDLDPDTVLVTPSSDRVFTIVTVEPDHIGIQYQDSEADRQLWRDQFAVLHERLQEDPEGVTVSGLSPGVEPYVSVLSLSPQYGVDESTNAFQYDPGSDEDSPYVRPAWEARTTPERLRDDTLLLSDLLGRHDVDDPGELSTDPLVNLYVLLSDVQHGSDRFRREVREELLDRIGPDATLRGQFGTVHRRSRERRHLKPAEEVFSVLDEEGIPREWVSGIDTDKLDVVLAVTDLDDRDVYDVTEQTYVQKTDVGEATKQSRLQGLEDRLALLDTDEADELRHEIDGLEDRLDEMIATE